MSLLRFVHDYPGTRNSPSTILRAIDEYARKDKYLMNVGEDKGRIVSNLITQHKPQVMLECGGYVGYSCILFASTLAAAHAADPAAFPAGPPLYYSLERDPLFAAVIASLADLAGLRDTVRVVTGPSDASILRLHADAAFPTGIDMLFLDHFKPAYTTDLQLLEQLGLVVPGRTLLCADNVVEPGNPPYLAYVRSSPAEKHEKLRQGGQRSEDVLKQFRERTAGQYKHRQGDEVLDVERTGDPSLVYESQLVESFEPTGVKDGVEVTRCVGREGWSR